MKRIQRSVVVSVVCTGLLATLSQTGCHAKKEAHEDGPVFETTSPVRTDTEATREYVCQIRAIQHIELRALESGYLQNVFVDEGQLVKRGQRMFQILPTLYEAELHKAKAEAAFVEIEYQNVKKLADRNVVSPNELALAKAKLDKANAQVEMAKVHLGFTEIKAPFDGLMDRLQARRGSLLEEGDLLTTLSDNSKMWVYFNVNEAEYLDYKTQHDASSTVQLMMANGKPFAHLGKVETIEGDFHNETGTIAFRATFPNGEGLLRHGETGKILAKTPLPNVLVVPQKSTFDVMDKKFVFVVDKAGVVHSKQIEVSIELQQIYVVKSGLTEQDEVMLEGLRKVKDGDKIATKHLDPKQVLAHLEVPAG